jgi:hypothetical protein
MAAALALAAATAHSNCGRWQWTAAVELDAAGRTEIVFESRLGAHDVGNDCTMTIGGTDFRIPQKGIAKKGNAFVSHKYAGKFAFCYKLGVDILAGNSLASGSRPTRATPATPTKSNAPETALIRRKIGRCRGG